jgi:hypothetical protein
MGLLQKLRRWWQGDADPAARAQAMRIREDIETRRIGDLTGQGNVTHRGEDSTGRP